MISTSQRWSRVFATWGIDESASGQMLGQSSAERLTETSNGFLRWFLRLWFVPSALLMAYALIWSQQGLYIAAAVLLAGGAASLAVHLGRMTLARWVFVLTLVLTVALAPLWINGIRSSVLMVVPVLVLLSAWMLGPRHALVLVLLLVCWLGMLWQLEEHGLWQMTRPLREPRNWFLTQLFCAVFCFLTVGALMANFDANIRREVALQNKLSSVLYFSDAVIQRSPLPMRVFDGQGACTKVNDAYADMVGLPLQMLLQERLEVFLTWGSDGLQQFEVASLRAGESVEHVVRARNAAGLVLWLKVHLLAFEMAGQRHLLVQMVDLTEHRRLTDELEALAFKDALTDLPNRRLFFDRLQQTLVRCQRSGEWAAVLLLDLNQFKQVNDTYGHEAGDQLLVEIARRLKGVVRASDTVARLGGDEFTILLNRVGRTRESAHSGVSSFLDKLREALAGAYELPTGRHQAGASVGYALISGSSAEDPETLMRQADARMYADKVGRHVPGIFSNRGGVGDDV